VNQRAQRIAAFCLLIILGANVILPAVWPGWQVALPHDHLFLGPVYPGWEHHHAGLTHAQKYYQHRIEPIPPLQSELTVFDPTQPAGSNVISLYRSPAGDDTLVSAAAQLLWLTEWPPLFHFPSLVWSISSTPQILSSAYLVPPDQPPSLNSSQAPTL
jgi:hypothetical protein